MVVYTGGCKAAGCLGAGGGGMPPKLGPGLRRKTIGLVDAARLGQPLKLLRRAAGAFKGSWQHENLCFSSIVAEAAVCSPNPYFCLWMPRSTASPSPWVVRLVP